MDITPSPLTKTLNKDFDTQGQRKAIDATLSAMSEVASTAQLTQYSNRSITEVEALQEEVSAVIPAGNIVGLVMGGLIRARDRSLPPNHAKSDVSALMRGLEMLPRSILPRTIYGTLFVGPAAVLAAYQKLLTLTGKDSNSAFPDGLWQFYLEFAMREDAARHTNETLGFQNALADYNLDLSPVDQLAAWICAVSQIYFQYDNLLYNRWREQVYIHLIEQAVAEANLSHKLSFKRLPQAWAVQRPYHRGQNARHDENYSQYRHRRFDNFLQSRLRLLPVEQRDEIGAIYNQRIAQELSAYQKQLSLLASLDPDQYRENKIPVLLWQARIGIVLQNRYYLLPACYTDQSGRPLLFETQENDSQFYALNSDSDDNLYDPQGYVLSVDSIGQIYRAAEKQPCGYLRPAPFQVIRRQVAAIFNHAKQADEVPIGGLDDQLITIKRSQQERVRRLIRDKSVQQKLNALKLAPIIINWDERPASKPLAYTRQGKRGVGDHPLTIFRTPNSMVFDQSHIFFDGIWGMALVEILTNEAISWATYFNNLAIPESIQTPPYHLAFTPESALAEYLRNTTPEVSAESSEISLRTLYELCKLLPKRHRDLKLTVNDILLLYRCQFGHEYRSSPELEDALFELRAQSNLEIQAIGDLINDTLADAQAKNPSIVIPMEATAANPQERLYPTTFRNPFTDFWSSYRKTATALEDYSKHLTQEHWVEFADARRSLLGQLNYFGQLIRAYKKVALEGGSTSAATIKLLAHLPDSLRKLLDEIPRRVDILNEILKGEEVFSNVGRVARGSSISRFVSAKDDNDNKTLVWAIVTDDHDTLHLSLRDFRPYVAALAKIDRMDLAQMIVDDYVNALVAGFNQFVTQLLEILNTNATHTSKEVSE